MYPQSNEEVVIRRLGRGRATRRNDLSPGLVRGHRYTLYYTAIFEVCLGQGSLGFFQCSAVGHAAAGEVCFMLEGCLYVFLLAIMVSLHGRVGVVLYCIVGSV